MALTPAIGRIIAFTGKAGVDVPGMWRLDAIDGDQATFTRVRPDTGAVLDEHLTAYVTDTGKFVTERPVPVDPDAVPDIMGPAELLAYAATLEAAA